MTLATAYRPDRIQALAFTGCLARDLGKKNRGQGFFIFTMNRTTFLCSICEDPHDIGVRLIYADWLEENGDQDRSDFIRDQCERAGIPNQEWHRRRERELIPRAWWAWCCPPSLAASQWSVCREQNQIAVCRDGSGSDVQFVFTFHRGFPELVTTDCQSWLTHGPSIVAAAPILTVNLSDRKPHRQRDVSELTRLPAAAVGPHFWYDARRQGGWMRDSHYLPNEIYDRLEWTFDLLEGQSSLATEADAYAALSRACVAFARSAAGLPPLRELAHA